VTSLEGLDPDPFAQFRLWYADAASAGFPHPNAMTLATAAPDGRPSARIMLLKGVDEEGFVFFTNYESQKARELDETPRAALLFFWAALDRQVRVEGAVAKTSREESIQYFETRPRDSQIGAWASRQSAVIAGREVLEQRIAQLEREYEGKEVLCPPFWGGYRLIPERFEFWIGRLNRLHDRFRYVRTPDGWVVTQLAP
jgi:pyridoxamine 5'-phosphate oxidase